MSTCNRLGLHTRGSQPVMMPKNLPDHCPRVLPLELPSLPSLLSTAALSATRSCCKGGEEKRRRKASARCSALPGKFLGIVSQDSSDSKSNQLHAMSWENR